MRYEIMNEAMNNAAAETVNRLPLIGDKAPAFKALTTTGTINFPEDYEGKWVLLFSHPSDFTSVCTTEFMTLASMQEEFDKINVSLIGLSVDSLYSHIAWVRAIEDLEWKDMKNIKIKFPDLTVGGEKTSAGKCQTAQQQTAEKTFEHFFCSGQWEQPPFPQV